MADSNSTSRFMVGLVLSSCLLALSACSGGGGGTNGSGGSSGNGGGFTVFNPSSPGSGFTRAATVDEQNRLLDQWWNALTAAPCWDSSFVTDPTLVGSVGGVSQYQFHSNYQYRHVGFSIDFGGIFFHDIGTYRGYVTAIIETWTGDVEAIAIYDNLTIVHVLKNPAGAPFYLAYASVGGGGACL